MRGSPPSDETTGTLTFNVIDSGKGISEEDQKLLFEPFVQTTAMRGTHAANSGTGLGLAIVRRMLDRMNGSIRLESTSGKGSNFTVEIRNLRFEWVEKSVDSPVREIVSDQLPPCRVLLVDDVPMNLKVLSAILGKLKAVSVSCTSGEAALELLTRESFDAVLTDLWMPGMNGAELAGLIRQQHPEVPVVAISADTDPESSFEMSAFVGVLQKPATADKLRVALSTVLEQG